MIFAVTNQKKELPVIRAYSSFTDMQKQFPAKAKDAVKIYKQICDYDDALMRKLGVKELQADEAGMVQFLTDKLSKGGKLYTIELNDTVVGIGVVIKALYENCWVLSLFGVEARSRGKGYGKTLLQSIVKEYSSSHIDMMLRVVATNTIALRLYESCGFKTEITKVLVCKAK